MRQSPRQEQLPAGFGEERPCGRSVSRRRRRRTRGPSPKRSLALRWPEHECNRASGESAASQADRRVPRQRRGRTAPFAPMRSCTVVYTLGGHAFTGRSAIVAAMHHQEQRSRHRRSEVRIAEWARSRDRRASDGIDDSGAMRSALRSVLRGSLARDAWGWHMRALGGPGDSAGLNLAPRWVAITSRVSTWRGFVRTSRWPD